MEKNTAADYIRENFEPSDRIAVVLLNKARGTVVQRIASAKRMAAPEFQAWLRHMNSRQHDIYISMNALREGAHHRTKADVEHIRHVFLDFDENGTSAVETLLNREDLPKPNYLINSSPHRWQVIWKIQQCTKNQAEEIGRALVSGSGADASVMDVARVLRIPGFYNHKYAHPYLVSVERLSENISTPEQFPRPDIGGREGTRKVDARCVSRGISQSEKDWAHVRDALRHGTDPEALMAELSRMRSDKFNPNDYARRTVMKALRSLQSDTPDCTQGSDAELGHDIDR